MAEYMMEFLSNILSVMNNWIVLILLLMLQYYFMKRPEKWMQLVLPAVYFILAIVDAALILMNGDISIPNQGNVIEVSAVILAVMTFLIGNLNTLLFVIVYKKHNASKSALAVTVTVVFLIGCILAAVMIYVLSFSLVLNDETYMNPGTIIGNRQYSAIEESNADYPVMLEDLGVAPMDYRSTLQYENETPMYKKMEFVDSMVDDVENPTKIVTIEYEIWTAVADSLDNREETLQNRSDAEPVETKLDYGAVRSYWLGDGLVLRYEDCVVYFDEASSRNLLEGEEAAAFFREEFELEKE